MKREIKFRAWDKSKQKMIPYVNILGLSEGFVCDFDRKWIHNSMNWDSEDGYSENYELMQYTGLKDKNGKEIYEGDILKWVVPDVLMNNDAPKNRFYVMLWVSNGFRAVSLHAYPYNESMFWPHINGYCEVIGNIYENPELLNQ